MPETIAKSLIPEALAHLPVASQLGKVDWNTKNLIFTAKPGGGKSLIIPALEASMGLRPGPILLRQPTRVTTEFVFRGIQKFWPDLNVGISTSAKKEGLDGADLIVFSDGSLKGLLARGDTPSAVYSDEAHLLSVQHEIEWALVRHLGLPFRAMSGSIDPKTISQYFDFADVHELTGRVFPIVQDTILAPETIFNRRDTFDLEGHAAEFCQMLLESSERGMFFVPTRAIAEKLAAKCAIDSAYLHGGVDPGSMLDWCAARATVPWCVFSTTAGATGITLPIEHVLMCDEEIHSTMERGIETVHATPLSDSSITQMSGRCGRLAEGTATLLTPHRGRNGIDRDRSRWLNLEDRQEVRPRPIDPPCQRITPYDVRVQMAAMGIPWSDTGALLSQIDPGEMDHAQSWLRSTGILLPQGDLSPLGKRVASFPLTAQYAHLVLSAPSKDLQLALLAALSLGLGGTHRLVTVKPEHLAARRASDAFFELWPRDCIVWGSIPLTLAKTLGAFSQAPDAQAWCDRNNLKHRPMAQALEDYDRAVRQFGVFPHNIETPAGHFEALRQPMWDHLSQHPLFFAKTIRQGVAVPRQPFSPADSVFREAMNLDRIDRPLRCVAIMRRQKTRAGGFFFPLDFIHMHPEERP